MTENQCRTCEHSYIESERAYDNDFKFGCMMYSYLNEEFWDSLEEGKLCPEYDPDKPLLNFAKRELKKHE